jgi:mannose-6-phosphate isomerase-like protein (cupin superfamily)
MYYKDSVHNPKFKETRGYLCGSFENAFIPSKNIEVAWQEDSNELRKHIGDKHHHEFLDELTMVIKGGIKEKIGDEIIEMKEGDFFFIEPGTITELIEVDDGTVLLVVKGPSLHNDKVKD